MTKGRPSKECWLCGSQNTKLQDPTMRECLDCNNVFYVMVNDRETDEPKEPDQTKDTEDK